MKKYRVVKAYRCYGVDVDREVGDIVMFPSEMTPLRTADEFYRYLSDRTAIDLGALEEVKVWEPKDGESVYKASNVCILSFKYDDTSGVHKSWLEQGLIYPTREQAEECLRRMLETAKKCREEVLGA